MIYRRVPDEREALCDSEAIAFMTGLDRKTVRRRLVPTACDRASRANLYALRDERLADLKPRARRRRA